MNQQTNPPRKQSNWDLCSHSYSTEIFASQIAQVCGGNKELKEAMEKDPKAAVNSAFPHLSFTEEFNVKVHHNSADTWHLTIPRYSGLYEEVEDVIADAHLENISAGEVFAFIGALVFTALGVSAAGAAAAGVGGAAAVGGATALAVGGSVAIGGAIGIAAGASGSGSGGSGGGWQQASPWVAEHSGTIAHPPVPGRL